MTIKSIGRSAREVFLTVGALLGALCIIATIAGVAFGVKPLVFRSGSMSPAIHTGDLAISQTVDASDLKAGDIVSVVNAGGNRVTHRLVNIASQGDARQLTLKGDANNEADAEVYTVTRAERVLFDIPKAGYVVNAAASPGGVFVLGMYVTAMLVLVFRRKGPDDGDNSSTRRRQGGARKADPKGARITSRTIATTAFAAGLAVAAPAAAAPWTDDVVIDGGTYTAHTVASQAQPACANVDGILVLGNIARLTWAQVDARYEYFWEMRRTDNSTLVASGTVGTGVAQGQTVTLDLGTGLIGVNTNYDVVIRARLVTPNTWIAASTTTTPVRRASIIIIGAAFRCGHV
jgi:signal peptidase I